jgi:hypothetical protein
VSESFFITVGGDKKKITKEGEKSVEKRGQFLKARLKKEVSFESTFEKRGQK